MCDVCNIPRVFSKRRDIVNHASMTSTGTKIMKNPICKALVNNTISYARGFRLSINDIRDVFKKNTLPHSSKTIYHLVKDTKKVRRSCRYVFNPMKVKLGIRAALVNQWIRHILRFNLTEIDNVLEQIEKDIEPP